VACTDTRAAAGRSRRAGAGAGLAYAQGAGRRYQTITWYDSAEGGTMAENKPALDAKTKAAYQKASQQLKAIRVEIQKMKADANAQDAKMEALDKALE
jgi:hypothetical protein